MTRRDKYEFFLHLAGAIALTLAALVICHVIGCSQQASVARSNTCEADMAALVTSASTCTEAQMRVDVLLRYSESCRALFGDAGLDVCAVLRAKGGTDAGRDADAR